MTHDQEPRHSDFPPDFQTFEARRRRFLDGLAAEALLREVANGAAPSAPRAKEDPVDTDPVIVEGELTVITTEHRLVMGYFEPGQRDLADIVRARLGFRDEAFGVGQVGRVRITIERLGREGAGKGRHRP